MVRAKSYKTIFDKGYVPNWTIEHFTVSQAVPPRRGTKRRVYKLVDYDNDFVKGGWFPEELQKISDNQYLIDKILQRRILPDSTRYTKTICPVRRLARLVQLLDKRNRQMRCHRWGLIVSDVATMLCEKQSRKQT